MPAEQACTSNGGRFCDGHGRCVGCVSAIDCPIPGTGCAAVTCTDNACVTDEVFAGAPCFTSGGHVCDGKGNCVDCAAPSDCPASGSMCAVPTCTANLCGLGSAARGAACADHGGAECDGDGHCTVAACLDGVRGGDETDVDCGGSCPPCADGRECLTGADCIDAICGTGVPKVCLAPTCSDGVRNGTETDVDCGGSCPPCAATRYCTVDADCAGGDCFGYEPGTCVSCSDGVKDGDETDVDCGGSTCALMGDRCALGQGCLLGSDCTSGYCPAGTCALKPDGTYCGDSSECENGHCLLDTCCHVACGAAAPSSCGDTGLCVASGARCAEYAAGTSCGSPSCSGGMLTQGSCDGSGSCGAGTVVPCPGHFACASTTVCGVSCQSDGDCTSGYRCQADRCK